MHNYGTNITATQIPKSAGQREQAEREEATEGVIAQGGIEWCGHEAVNCR